MFTFSVCNTEDIIAIQLLNRYTSQISGDDVTVYAILLFWPDDNTITLGAPVPSSTTVISMLGYSGNFDWKPYAGLNKPFIH
jgi:hypothetical protein